MTEELPAPKVKAHRTGLFETPVVFASLDGAEAMIAALRERIEARCRDEPGVQRSNQGGWHSDTRMLDWGGDSAARLAEIARGVAQRMTAFEGATIADFEWRTTMWANVSRSGDLNHLHAHPGNVWAAVFYVDMGGDATGSLYLEDPRFPLTLMRSPAIRMVGVDGQAQRAQVDVKARAGDLIVFPAWLRHGVRAHSGTGDRISIAMNIDLAEKR